ncbi:LHFPL tetraspan subfamily member 2a protein-like [Neocloeon triangulifer]|uniref:LHFPL tetraspan subfamily member 2a protein-like n=1 Tax=Neocloeon triangulifer TaxID=2078957 RepID=UPI00286F6A07|nr:LHFPL tetraspan subfamily member 2a protein-like [Neocloeon triangulifer]
MQCFVIITTRSLLWTLLTLVSTLAVLSSILTARWLVGPEHKYHYNVTTVTEINSKKSYAVEEQVKWYGRTLGIFTRCTLIKGREHCAPFVGLKEAEGGAGFPIPWQVALVFLTLGVLTGIVTTMAALLGCCVQAVCGKKSLFSVAGAAQAAAGLLYVVGLMMFPFGFGSERVQRLCGHGSAVFYLEDCTLGWSFYVALLGIIGTFICAVLSSLADKAMSSDRIQEEIDDGKILICLP